MHDLRKFINLFEDAKFPSGIDYTRKSDAVRAIRRRGLNTNAFDIKQQNGRYIIVALGQPIIMVDPDSQKIAVGNLKASVTSVTNKTGEASDHVVSDLIKRIEQLEKHLELVNRDLDLDSLFAKLDTIEKQLKQTDISKLSIAQKNAQALDRLWNMPGPSDGSNNTAELLTKPLTLFTADNEPIKFGSVNVTSRAYLGYSIEITYEFNGSKYKKVYSPWFGTDSKYGDYRRGNYDMERATQDLVKYLLSIADQPVIKRNSYNYW